MNPTHVPPCLEIVDGYAKAIRAARNREQLLGAIEPYRKFADDAWHIAEKMTDQDFYNFKKGLRKETRGIFAGDGWAEQFGNITVPDVMLLCEQVKHTYKVPFGLAFNRLIDSGQITIKNKVAILNIEKP